MLACIFIVKKNVSPITARGEIGARRNFSCLEMLLPVEIGGHIYVM